MLLGERARLTIVDVVFIAVALAAVGFLIGPMYAAMNANISELDTGTAYLMRMVPAGLVLTLLVIAYTSAIGREAT